MIQTETVDLSFADQAEDQFMSRREDVGILHPHPRQLLDVEEATVVNLVKSGFPESQPVRLGFQELVESIESLRLARDAVELFQAFFNILANGRACVEQARQPRAG